MTPGVKPAVSPASVASRLVDDAALIGGENNNYSTSPASNKSETGISNTSSLMLILTTLPYN